MIAVIGLRTYLLINAASLALLFWLGSDRFQECSGNGGGFFSCVFIAELAGFIKAATFIAVGGYYLLTEGLSHLNK